MVTLVLEDLGFPRPEKSSFLNENSLENKNLLLDNVSRFCSLIIKNNMIGYNYNCETEKGHRIFAVSATERGECPRTDKQLDRVLRTSTLLRFCAHPSPV
mgnify:CR=1 FL=1